MYYSQYNQDEILNRYLFNNAKRGIFCDVGAHDGINISNTYFFEKELDWTGICIEANPENFEQLQKNRTCNLVNGAAYFKNGEISFTSNEGYTNMLSGVTDAYNKMHLYRIQHELDIYGGNSKEIMIPCYRLDSLFEKYNITTVDYLSIDTEGSEFQVLIGIDFTKVHINVIDFEVNYPDSTEHEDIRNFLEMAGFQYWNAITGDEIWINNSIKYSWQL